MCEAVSSQCTQVVAFQRGRCSATRATPVHQFVACVRAHSDVAFVCVLRRHLQVLSSEDSYGIDTHLDGLLLHPMMAGLGLQSGTHGVGAVERSFALEPTLPRLRQAAPTQDPAPALPSVMLDHEQVLLPLPVELLSACVCELGVSGP